MISEIDGWIGKWVQSSCAVTNRGTRYSQFQRPCLDMKSHQRYSNVKCGDCEPEKRELRSGTGFTAVLLETWEDRRMNAETMQYSTYGVRFA